jgi:hypothetical protein
MPTIFILHFSPRDHHRDQGACLPVNFAPLPIQIQWISTRFQRFFRFLSNMSFIFWFYYFRQVAQSVCVKQKPAVGQPLNLQTLPICMLACCCFDFSCGRHYVCLRVSFKYCLTSTVVAVAALLSPPVPLVLLVTEEISQVDRNPMNAERFWRWWSTSIWIHRVFQCDVNNHCEFTMIFNIVFKQTEFTWILINIFRIPINS